METDPCATRRYVTEGGCNGRPWVCRSRLLLGATLIGDARVTEDDDDPGVKMCGQRPSDTIEARAVPRPTTWP